MRRQWGDIPSGGEILGRRRVGCDGGGPSEELRVMARMGRRRDKAGGGTRRIRMQLKRSPRVRTVYFLHGDSRGIIRMSKGGKI